MRNLANARARRFHAYVERLTTALGHQDRHGPLRAYVTGLCLPGDRKSIEPMAARVDPRHVRARHQSMHHFIANAAWDDAAVLRVARETVLAALERHGPVAAWVVDDTGIPKKGRHSVGVARQYCGVLGKQDNCQVAVSLSVAHEQASMPVAYRLYLPEAWANDHRRRRTAGVPDTVEFRPKWQLAVEQISQLAAEGVPAAPVVADAGYGPPIATTGGRRPGRKSTATLDLQVIKAALQKTLDSSGRLKDVNTAVVAGLRIYARF
jgi:SRSO17 transposase